MFKANITLPTEPVSADSENGVAAVEEKSVFRLSPVLDGGQVSRIHPILGDLRIAHQNSREFGAGTRRTLVRFTLKENGNLPAASAHLVLTGHTDGPGISRQKEAFNLLLNAILSMAINPDFSASAVYPTAIAPTLELETAPESGSGAATDTVVNFAETEFVSRLIGGEG